MKPYVFDDARKSIKIDRVDLPQAWINYLSNGKLHGFISQAAGGPLWYKHPSQNRLTRYRTYNIPIDSPGFYIYIREEDGTVWSPAWRPAETKLDSYCAEHMPGKTVFHAEKNGTKADFTVFITPDYDVCLWNLELTASEDKHFDVFAYAELSQYDVTVESTYGYYTKHMLNTWFDENTETLTYMWHYPAPLDMEKLPLTYFACDRKIASYSGDRDSFLGNYRNDTNPICVEKNQCGNDTIQCGNPCFAMQVKLDAKKNKTEKVSFMLGVAEGAAKHFEEATAKMNADVAALRKESVRRDEEEKLSNQWENFFSKFECEIPDKVAERQINIWGPIASKNTMRFSRSINAEAVGVRGFGYRDSCQDMLSVTYRGEWEAVKENIRQLMTYQDPNGNNAAPGKMPRSDEHLWPPMLVYSIIAETGDTSFLNDVYPYYPTDGQKAEDTVWKHLLKAIDFTEKHLGAHGIALTLDGDWNDIINRFSHEGKGESVFAAMQYVKVLGLMIEIAELIGDKENKKLLEAYREKQTKAIEDTCWNGKWWYRCFDDNGQPIGGENDEFGKIWINSQTWSVISGVGSDEQHQKAMKAVHDMLDTGNGLLKLTPGFDTYPKIKDPFSAYNPGTSENGAIFCHAHTWAIIAETMLGNADLAWKYYTDILGDNLIGKLGVETFKAEPYTWCSNIVGKRNSKYGWGNVVHISGTVTWMNVAATQYLLGVRPTLTGVLFDPCLPADWDNIKVKRELRGCMMNITYRNPDHVQKGIKYLEVNGKKIEGNFLDASLIKGEKQLTVIAVMG